MWWLLLIPALFAAFALKYLWRTIRYGYWHNSYEVEARAAESKTK